MRATPPPVVDLVLVGGGHSHVQVLRSLGMQPLRGVRVIVVSREVFTPYSGMLPGYVAGRYGWHDVHIDLGPLTRFAGGRLIADEVVSLDLQAKTLELAGHPPVRYDLLSINCGGAPAAAGACAVPVKPIGRFLPRWDALLDEVATLSRVALIGGGAGGVELALAMRRVLPEHVAVSLLTDALLPDLTPGAVAQLRADLATAGVEVQEGFRVTGVTPQAPGCLIEAGDGRRETAERVFWVTGVAAPAWLREAGLAADQQGFARVDASLRSLSHPDVFVTGDAAALDGQERPKAGVFAVREGPVLSANLRRVVAGRRLERFKAQRRYLVLIGTGDGRAVAARGGWVAAGRWVWRWKDWIDRRFMTRFQRLPPMAQPVPDVPRALRDRLPEAMRCGGCGAKLAADPLRRVLARLPDQRRFEQRSGVAVGIGEDAAVLARPAGDLILTVDGFRSLVDDPYRFGRITAHHALNDILAMGGSGLAALAMATVPLMAERMMEDELFLLLSGAVAVLNDHDVPLVGGHSAEGDELSLALTITGVQGESLLRKSGLKAGDALILTKALGTGAVLAAHMRARAASDRVAAALSSMDSSNAAALTALRRHGVTALTDVSGFGLLGHLGELLRASTAGVELDLAAVPVLRGADELVREGLVSSLQADNELALRDFQHSRVPPGDARLRLLSDPQTSGGLLAGVPAKAAAECLGALRDAGYAAAAIIGTVTATGWTIHDG